MKIQNPFRLGLFGGLGALVAVAIGAPLGSLATSWSLARGWVGW